ncbi:SUN domain-containing protein 3-like protein [Aix galericulata]|nr:SUN domain-containing protein 3-like protein [Aix galericulata]
MERLVQARAALLQKREKLARRGAISWLWTFCLIFVCLELAVLFMLGIVVLYASCYDQEFFYHLLLHVLPEDTYADLVYFLEDTLSLTTLAVPEAEHESTGTSLVWLDQKRQELQEKEAHVSAAVEQFVQAVSKVLEDNHIQGEKRENILHFTRNAFEKPSISPGDCWAFQGSQGHVVIRLPVKIWPAAFTIWHISRAVSPSGEVSSAPKEFAVSVSLCLALIFGRPWPQGKAAPESVGVDEDKVETLLGLFTYDVDGMIAQTFHVQKEPPKTFRHIRLEVRSNWGNPEYTCIYRVQVHGQIEKPQEFLKHE